MQTIDIKQLAEKQSLEQIDLIDVRMPTEFRHVHATYARSVPLDSLDPSAIMKARNGSASQPLYVICHSGSRSSQACRKFIEAGYDNVVSVEGGTQAWEKAGLPVVRGKKSMPLMQQVQITAGFLIVLGTVLGKWVHPYGYGLSAFVGAGLMFAGFSGLCPMANLIAKMPWNKGESGGSCSV